MRASVAELDAETLAALNSTPMVDGVAVDELDDPARAAEILLPFEGDGSTAQVKEFRKARDLLQEITNAKAPTADLERQLSRVSLRPTVADGAIQWNLDAPASVAPAARLVLAWNGINERMPGRLRPCANPECTKFLLDRSKPNTARWCSMATCGNRLKARRHHSRRTTRAE